MADVELCFNCKRAIKSEDTCVDIGIQVGKSAPISAYYFEELHEKEFRMNGDSVHGDKELEINSDNTDTETTNKIETNREVFAEETAGLVNNLSTLSPPKDSNMERSGYVENDPVVELKKHDQDVKDAFYLHSSSTIDVIGPDILSDMAGECSAKDPCRPDPSEMSGDIDPSIELGTAAELDSAPGQVVIITRSFESLQMPRRRWRRAVNIRKAVHRLNSTRLARSNRATNKRPGSNADESESLSGGFRRIVLPADANGLKNGASRNENIEKAGGGRLGEVEAQNSASGLIDEVMMIGDDVGQDTESQEDANILLEADDQNRKNFMKSIVKRNSSTKEMREEESKDIDPAQELQIDAVKQDKFADVVILSRSFESAPASTRRWKKIRNVSSVIGALHRVQRSDQNNEVASGNENINPEDGDSSAGRYISGGYRRISLSAIEDGVLANRSNKKSIVRFQMDKMKKKRSRKEGKRKYKNENLLAEEEEEESAFCHSPMIR